MVRVAASQLDERVTVERPDTTTNDHNEVVEGYASIGKFWAGWRPSTGSERQQAEKVEAALDGEFTLRRSSATRAITHRFRITRANGDAYMVVGTPSYGRDRGMYMKLPARRVTDG